MLLSIAMMVKNEEKHLEECLKSLQSIRDKIESELIIVDTGSIDKTVEIAKKFTDKVYFHNWNDNFSEMRNITINYSKGDWIFIIDGDEVLSDSKGIIEFFTQKQYFKYKSAAIKVKNLQSMENEDYALITSTRLFKNDGEFYYSGAIHNQAHYNTPTATINSDIIHYGYLSDDFELMERKFKRTATLLRKELEKDPDNVHYRYQLSVSYAMHKDFKESLEEARKSYDCMKNLNKSDHEKYIFVYNNYVNQLLKNAKYEEAEKIVKEALKINKNNLDLYLYIARVKFINKFYEEAKEFYEKYLAILKNEDISKISDKLIVYTADKYEVAYEDLFIIYCEEYNYKLAKEMLHNINDTDFVLDNMNKIVKCFIINNDFKELKDYYIKFSIGENEIAYKLFLYNAEEFLRETEENLRIEFYTLFSDEEDNYSMLNRIRIQDHIGELASISNIIEKLVSRINLNKAPMFFGDALYYAMKIGLPLDNLFMQVSEKNLDVYLQYIKQYHADFNEVVENYLKSKISENIKSYKVVKALVRTLLSEENLNNSDYLTLMNLYVNCGINYIDNLYKPEVLDEEFVYEMKNDEEIFFLIMRKANSHIENNDELSYIRNLRKALEYVPAMKRGIELLLKEVMKEKESPVNYEMETLKKNFKENIKSLIDAGDLQNAEILLEQYFQSGFGDSEAYSMKAVIFIMNENIDMAETILKEGLTYNHNDFELNYNMAYLYERKGMYLNALETYEKIVFNIKDSEQRQQIIEYLNKLEDEHKEVIQKQVEENEKVVCESLEKKLNLHFMYDSQYCDKFIHFVNKNFPKDEHKFIIIGNAEQKFKYMNIEGIENVQIINSTYDLINCIEESSEIFIHYLFDYFCEIMCKFNISKPINWICWGGDFYNYIDIEMYDTMTKEILKELGVDANKTINKNNIQYIYRKRALRKISKILISNKEDFDEIKNKFIINAKYTTFTYPNPVDFISFNKNNVELIKDKYRFKKKFKYLILLGNSANPSNNHVEILYELKKLNSKDFAVIVPLSYGGYDSYVNYVIKLGKKLLGKQFIPITEYIESEEYFEILKQVDVAIFNHNRQQARGNIRILLYLGKKVYIKNTITTFSYFKSIGLRLYDISEINKKKIDEIASVSYEDKENNRDKIYMNFSTNKCLQYINEIFNN